MNCPICNGQGGHLGPLGLREHFRCRQCGIDFSQEAEPEEKRDQDNETE